MNNWSVEETQNLVEEYVVDKDIESLATKFGKSNLQVLRKLVSMKIYEKKERPIKAMNKDMLAREIFKLLGIKVLTMSNMAKEDLKALLEHLEENENKV